MQLLRDHADFIIVDKPPGVNFHGEAGENGFQCGVADMAAKQFGYSKLWSVHRLDKMTSGLLILAKNAEAAAQLSVMFAERKIAKFYLALADKKPKKKQGWIKGDMLPARRGSFMLAKTMNNPAVTQFLSTSVQAGLRLFLIKPHTGKTHQIRVALKSLGSPVIGDHRYQNLQDADRYDRGYLHAYALDFNWHGETIRLLCKPQQGEWFNLPAVQTKLDEWQSPWLLFKS
ncbi:TIGR01621 family pseudouridine synthase [Thiomicrorhabdus xiamenensis]|uniref:TIGR01621 family pseudouridine synthase n=1 Tax=Thiomicrorhabdus xiamenensis TaxID=2739063 RepID=A0A7D4T0L4_9GAMM|nr:TIGR01621 family pseudouridine synthase [Thiomicrorhabdus xiamenensis]QKI89302.1 TIGR01621 family pseudouridine synthase [Thiomicrorhabdus xiamenensis]